MQVIDHRLKLVYRIGSNEVAIDGVQYSTTEPMSPEIVIRLSEIVLSAEDK